MKPSNSQTMSTIYEFQGQLVLEIYPNSSKRVTLTKFWGPSTPYYKKKQPTNWFSFVWHLLLCQYYFYCMKILPTLLQGMREQNVEYVTLTFSQKSKNILFILIQLALKEPFFNFSYFCTNNILSRYNSCLKNYFGIHSLYIPAHVTCNLDLSYHPIGHYLTYIY